MIKKFCKLIPRKSSRLIFDLDHTLWDTTVDHNRYMGLAHIERKVHSETGRILQEFQDQGYSLNIASQSLQKDKCNEFLKFLFPDIIFDKIIINPQSGHKTTHIADIHAPNTVKPFVLFDDNCDILNMQKRLHPESVFVHSFPQLTLDTLDKFLKER